MNVDKTVRTAVERPYDTFPNYYATCDYNSTLNKKSIERKQINMTIKNNKYY